MRKKTVYAYCVICERTTAFVEIARNEGEVVAECIECGIVDVFDADKFDELYERQTLDAFM